MQKPRLVYYNDAHHFNAKRIEPPASIHKLQWPVDEVLGTGVDLLVWDSDMLMFISITARSGVLWGK